MVNAAAAGECEVFYWRDRNVEVDFVVKRGRALTAVEVKSGRRREVPQGLIDFEKQFRPQRVLLVGGDGLGIEQFLSRSVAELVA